jgi:hypothetical protein
VTQQRSWPQRYLVTVCARGDVRTYKVVTWLDESKARAIALEAHRRDHPDSGVAVADVEVVDAGPVARDERGRMAIERDALTDRMEF